MQGHRFSEDRPESFRESAERKLPVGVGTSRRRKWPLRATDKEIAVTKHSVPQLFPSSPHLLSFRKVKAVVFFHSLILFSRLCSRKNKMRLFKAVSE